MRSVKNTSINVGLLNAPIKIFVAASADPEIKFNYCGPNGEAVKQVYTAGTDIIPKDDLGKSYEGVMLDKSELALIEEESMKDDDGSSLEALRVRGFIPMKDLPVERIMQTYIIGPDLKSSDGEDFEIFVTSLKRKKVVAIAKMVLRSRQKLLALFVKDDKLYACALSFAAQVSVLEETELRATHVTPSKPLLTMMGKMIDAMVEPISLVNDQVDTFVDAKKVLVEQIREGKPVVVKTAKKAGINSGLAEALEESMKVLADKGKVPA